MRMPFGFELERDMWGCWGADSCAGCSEAIAVQSVDSRPNIQQSSSAQTERMSRRDKKWRREQSREWRLRPIDWKGCAM